MGRVGKVVVVVVCCALASCGGGGSDTGPTSTSQAPEPSTSVSVATSGSSSTTSTDPPPVSTPTTSSTTTVLPTVTSTTTAPAPGASTTTADGSPVPSAVAATANAILAAARAGDYARLGALASAPGFTYSFGEGGGDPGAFWASTPGSTSTLVEILTQTPARDSASSPGTWVWPGAWVSASEEDDAAYGPRLGIAEDGTWEWFVLGGD